MGLTHMCVCVCFYVGCCCPCCLFLFISYFFVFVFWTVLWVIKGQENKHPNTVNMLVDMGFPRKASIIASNVRIQSRRLKVMMMDDAQEEKLFCLFFLLPQPLPTINLSPPFVFVFVFVFALVLFFVCFCFLVGVMFGRWY